MSTHDAIHALACVELFDRLAPWCSEDTEKRWASKLVEIAESLFGTEFGGEVGALIDKRQGEHEPNAVDADLRRTLTLVVLSRFADGDVAKRLRKIAADMAESAMKRTGGNDGR